MSRCEMLLVIGWLSTLVVSATLFGVLTWFDVCRLGRGLSAAIFVLAVPLPVWFWEDPCQGG